MRFRSVSFITSIALLTLLSSSITTGVFPGRSNQALAQTQDDRKAEADRLLQQAREQYQTSQFQAALELSQQALEIYRDIGDRAGEGSTLNGIGAVYLNLRRYPQALESLQQALSIRREVDDRAGEGTTLNNIGLVYRNQEQYPQALEYLQQALSIAQEVDDRAGEGTALNNIGLVYAALGQYPQSLDSLQQALVIAQEISDRTREEQILNDIEAVNRFLDEESSQVPAQTQDGREAEADRLSQQGNQQLRSNQFQDALQFFQQSLRLYQEIGNRTGEGITLFNIGSAYRYLRQYPQALEHYQQALAISREDGNRAGEGIMLIGIGLVYKNLGQYPQALEHYQQALAISREDGNRAGEGITLFNIGSVYRYLRQYPQALEHYQQALAISREDGNRAGERNTLNGIGLVYDALGQYSQALEYYQQALTINREVGDRAEESTNLNNIGLAYNALGQYPQALEHYQQALAIRREVGDRAGEGNTLNGVGAVYEALGQYLQALEYYQQALAINREVGDRAREGTFRNNIGLAHVNLGQYPQALDYFQQALAIRQEVGDRSGEGTTLNNMGLVYANLGQYPQALGYFEQALAITQEVGDRAGEGTNRNNIGLVYADLGQYAQAVDSYQQALSIQQEIGDRASEGTTLNNMGATLFESGQLQPAETALLDALTVLDELRQQDFSDAEKISLFDTQVNTYEILQQVQIAQNKFEPALETSERGRARAFVSLLSQRLQESEVTTNLPAPSVSDIQQTAREQNATLVQYSVIHTAVTPAIYIWVIKPTGEITFRSVELNEENQQTLSGAIDTAFGANAVFRGESTTISNLVSDVLPTRSVDRNVEFEYNPELANDRLRQLHQLLIEPIADLLPTNPTDRIVFIPQGGLFLVPFAALQDANGDYLIENHTISIAPSIQVLDLTQQADGDRSSENALIVGNPVMPDIWDTQTSTEVQLAPLPGAEREAESIAQLLNTNAIIGEAATETAIVQQMPNARIIHLATHGLLEYGIPSESGVLDVPGAIALAPSGSDDGLLTSAEILEMNLQAELVVLSACDTGRGDITGDGVVGLSRALISAGVPSVVVSLWAVPDAPTAELMSEFYRQMQSNPDKAQALRQAMLITMQQHPDPKDWAAFTLIGEAE